MTLGRGCYGAWCGWPVPAVATQNYTFVSCEKCNATLPMAVYKAVAANVFGAYQKWGDIGDGKRIKEFRDALHLTALLTEEETSND